LPYGEINKLPYGEINKLVGAREGIDLSSNEFDFKNKKI